MGRLCRKTGTYGGSSNGFYVYFTADECGGVKPDASWTGALSRAHVSGGIITAEALVGGSPGVSGYRIQTGSRSYDVAAVYVPTSSVIDCARDTNPGSVGSYRVIFNDGHCTGGVEPDTSYIGVARRHKICGGVEEVQVDDASASNGPNVWMRSRSTTCNPARAAAVYLPAADVIVCSKTVSLSGSSGRTVTFTASDCGGVLPDAHYVGMAKQIRPCNGYIGYYVYNGPSPRIWVYPTSSFCGTSYFKAVYIRR